MRIISVLNDKGGVGKTIVASLLSDAALILRKRVLVIDLDPQATLSRERLSCYGLLPEEEPIISPTDPSLADFLVQRGDLMNYVIGLGNHVLAPEEINSPEDYRLAVIWPGYHLTDVMETLDQAQLRDAYAAVETWLDEARDSGRWDYCIIDNPPNRSGLSKRLAMRSDVVVIPALPEPGSYEATGRTIATIGSVPMIVVPNRFQGRIFKSHHEYVEMLQQLRIKNLIEVANTIPSSALFLQNQAQGRPTLLTSISMPPIKATHDMIVRALALPGKAWFWRELRQAYEDYKPAMAAFNTRLIEYSVARYRQQEKEAQPSPAN